MSSTTQEQKVPMLSSMQRSYWNAILGASFVGFSPILVRLTSLGPIAAGFYRLLLALPFLWIWGRWSGQKIGPIPRQGRLGVLLAGLFFAVDVGLWHTSLHYTTVVNSTLLCNLAVLIVPLLGWVCFGEKPGKRFAGILILALFGTALLTTGGLNFRFESALGDGLAVGASFALASYIVAVGQLRRSQQAIGVMWWTSIVTAVCLGLFALLNGESLLPATAWDWGVILALGALVHAAGQGLITSALGMIPAHYLAVILLIEPALSAVLAWVLFGESMTGLRLLGAAIVGACLVVVQLDRSRS